MTDEELKRLLDEHTAILSERIHRVAILADETKDRVEILAESLLETREEMRRKFDALDETIDRTTAETRAILKYSYTGLDRRLTALEDAHR